MKKQQDIQRILEEFNDVLNIPGIKTAKKKVLIAKIKNDKGECITSRKGIVDVFGEFYKRLDENNERDDFEHEMSYDRRIPEITTEELQNEICKLKKSKSTDSNGIRVEDIKAYDDETREMMRQIFNEIIKRNNFTSDEWKKVKIKVILKKVDVENMSNYRPICSLPALYKLFSTILYGKIIPNTWPKKSRRSDWIQKKLPDNGPLANVQIDWTEMSWVENQNGTATVDFTKTFDSISHKSIWDAFKSCNVDHEYVSLLRKIYRDQKTSIQTDEESNIFDIQKGSKQGDPISSLLFNTVLQYSLKEELQHWQKKKGMGIYLSDHVLDYLTNWDLPTTWCYLQPPKNRYGKWCVISRKQQRKWDSGFTQTRRRFSVTRAPSIRTHKKHIEVDDMSMEILTRNQSVKDLGQRISYYQQETIEIKSRIRTAWTPFHKYRQELTSKKYMLKHRLRLSTPQFLRLPATQREHGLRTKNTQEWFNRHNARYYDSLFRRKGNTKRLRNKI